jgi:imidazolonepropionase-like amidohydrolase
MHAVRAPSAFDGNGFLPGGATVLIDGDRIAGVEAFGCALPDGCTLAAYDGTVLPGLFDVHTHLVSDGSLGALDRLGPATDEELDATAEASLATQARAGVTTVRDLGDRRYRTLVARDRELPGAPRILAAGPPLTVPDGHCHVMGGAVAGPGEIRAAVAEHRDRGVDVIKVMASGGMLTAGTDVLGVQFPDTELRLLVDCVHEAGLSVVAHAHSLASIELALAAGVDGIEHFTGLTEGGIRVPDDLLDRTAAAGVAVDPTLGLDRTVLATLPAPPPSVVEALRRAGLDVDTLQTARRTVVGRMRGHGVRVVTGVDSGAAPVKPHGSIALALAELVDAGYPMAEALATATSAAAEACGLADVTGALRAGLAADLLVVDGDLRDGPAPLGRPVSVLIRGVEVEG